MQMGRIAIEPTQIGRIDSANRPFLITEEYQWTLELCDLLLDSAQEVTEAKALKASALRYLAEYETSANGRHYYLASARELTE